MSMNTSRERNLARVTTYVPASARDRLDALAERESCTRANLVRRLLVDWLSRPREAGLPGAASVSDLEETTP